MRILTWNINGIRTLPQYHPWNSMATFSDILDALEADILCFQEVKSTRSSLTGENAVPSGYNALFSFPVRKNGYSGVSVYVRALSAAPLKAEEGLCSIVQSKPPLSDSERVSGHDAYPQHVLTGRNDDDEEKIDFKAIDSEGRALVVDFGLFVLINVYCPNDGGTEERTKYKNDFHTVLEARVKGMVEAERREVIVVGDLNACAEVIDHCEGHIMAASGQAKGLEGEEGFWGVNARRWLKNWMVPEDGGRGSMIDVTRRLWPDRKAMYTCWNTKISARETNYGTRIDYILITKGLLPWVKAADIQPQIKGSDHCPVYLDLHEEIPGPNGSVLKLQDAMKFTNESPTTLPRILSKFWPEHSGKQKLLQHFFNPSVTSSQTVPASPVPTSPRNAPIAEYASDHIGSSQDSTIVSSSSQTANDSSLVLSGQIATTPSVLQSTQSSSSLSKRKLSIDNFTHFSVKKSKQKKDVKKEEKDGVQAKLSSFFKSQGVSTSSTIATGKRGSIIQVQDDGEIDEVVEVVETDVDTDLLFAQTPSSSSEREALNDNGADSAETKRAWSSLMAPIQAPKCSGHGELCKEFTVSKQGPNRGKKFFICSRPVGPGYDKGNLERLRQHVDPQYRCNFFKWSSEVRRQMRKKGQSY